MLAVFESIDGVIAIVIVAVLIFGGKAIPKIARGLGSAKTEFEKGLKTGKATEDETTAADAKEEKAPGSDK